MHLLYNAAIDTAQTFAIDEEENRHVRALRLKDGDQVWVTNGQGLWCTCVLTWKKHDAYVEVLQSEIRPEPSPKLILAVAPTKNTDRLEWLIEKAVEIGVSEIIPIACQHSERVILKTERLVRVAVAAMKQSQKAFLPQIHELTQFAQLVKSSDAAQKFIAHCYSDTPRQPLHKTLKPGTNALICIGPEGDFSKQEIEMASAYGFEGISLGNSRLRTETAGMVAVTTFDIINQQH
jgi:16S rRNA (uracil1498-N3)-methyltransferase